LFKKIVQLMVHCFTQNYIEPKHKVNTNRINLVSTGPSHRPTWIMPI
jgi:hypothetical protein